MEKNMNKILLVFCVLSLLSGSCAKHVTPVVNTSAKLTLDQIEELKKFLYEYTGTLSGGQHEPEQTCIVENHKHT